MTRFTIIMFTLNIFAIGMVVGMVIFGVRQTLSPFWAGLLTLGYVLNCVSAWINAKTISENIV
jgi:hypothetical protein